MMKPSYRSSPENSIFITFLGKVFIWPRILFHILSYKTNTNALVVKTFIEDRMMFFTDWANKTCDLKNLWITPLSRTSPKVAIVLREYHGISKSSNFSDLTSIIKMKETTEELHYWKQTIFFQKLFSFKDSLECYQK